MANNWAKQHAAAEKKLAQKLKAFFDAQTARVLGSLGNNLTPGSVADHFDATAETRLFLKAAGPTIQATMILGAGNVLRDFATDTPRGTKAAAPAGDFKLPQRVSDAVDEAFDGLSKQAYWRDIQRTTQGLITDVLTRGIEEGLSIPNLAKELRDTLGGMSDWRAEAIARTETTLAYNAGHEASYSELADDGLIWGRSWLSIIDQDTREDHVTANGQQKAAGENFEVGGEEAPYPCHFSLSAKQRVRCRCTTKMVREAPAGKQTTKPQVAVPELPATPAADKQKSTVEELAANVRALIKAGVKTKADVRAVGNLIRQYVDPDAADYAKKRDELLKKYEAMGPGWAQAWSDAKKLKADYVRDRRERYIEAMGTIRPMGIDKDHPFTENSDAKAKAAINEVQQFYPRDWLERSHSKHEVSANIVDRGYYHPSETRPQINLSEDEAGEYKSVAAHELGHRMEHLYPSIGKLERELYDRRTKGEKLQQIPGLRDGEVSRPDDWFGEGKAGDQRSRAAWYSGKSYEDAYGDRHWEIFTQAMEGITSGRKPIEKDEEVFNFVLGVLATVK